MTDQSIEKTAENTVRAEAKIRQQPKRRERKYYVAAQMLTGATVNEDKSYTGGNWTPAGFSVNLPFDPFTETGFFTLAADLRQHSGAQALVINNVIEFKKG